MQLSAVHQSLAAGSQKGQIRDLRPIDLMPLAAAGKAAIVHKYPLSLNKWRAQEVAMGLPLGDSAVLDPVAALRCQQLCWLQLLSNSLGLAGIVHRTIACPGNTWREPSKALQSALRSMGWSVRRNTACARASQWPHLSREQAYPGQLVLTPVDSFPMPGAVFTDGSLSSAGGGGSVGARPGEGHTVLHLLPKE